MPVMSARFIRETLPVTSIPGGFELVEELTTALLLVGLADGGGGATQSVERAQEAAVRLVGPAHIARTAPSRLAQPVEAAVVTDAEARVSLHVVAGKRTQAGPC